MTADDIRNALIERAQRFCVTHHTSLSAIGDDAVNDSKFLMRVKNGLGFNINTYQKVVDWLDEKERERAA